MTSLGAAVLGCCALAFAGCSSSAQNASSSSGAASLQRACVQISAALADGPDPDTDPVGYAEAQIRPLRQIRTDDHQLQEAINALDAAYEQQFASNDAAAGKAVTEASKQVDAVCPGATS
jgi:hypothetical protein